MMIRKRASMTMLGILFVLGACNPSSDEGNALTDPPETEKADEVVENTEPDNATDPQPVAQTYEEILEEVKAAIQTDVEVKIPDKVLTNEGYLTAATDSNASSYEVNFFVTNVPVAVNDPLLQDAHPYMIVNGTKFESAESAKAKVNYEPLVDGAEETDLGYGITGHMDAGAGSVFLTWHEGRWSFSVRNHNNGNGREEMIELAKQIVGKLESQLLPAPHDSGAGMFDMNSNGAAANSIIWQEGTSVYEIYTGDPLLLIDTVTGYMGQ